MTYVITDACKGTCDTTCVDVCPVDCISGPIRVNTIRELQLAGKYDKLEHIQMYIDPEGCIDCGACEPECPVSAIFADFELPSPLRGYIEQNAVHFAG